MQRTNTHSSHRSPSAIASALTALLICSGCSKKLDGPTPVLSKSKLPVAPAIVCGDQRSTELTLSGENFSPVPVDIPKDPAIALPSLTLQRSAALDGSDAESVAVRYGGDPTAPSNTAALKWEDAREMTFTIDQDLTIEGKKGRVPSGIYDAQLINPNGKQATAKGVLAVVDKPELTETPALVCLAQGAREVVLRGTGLLRIEDALPRVDVDGVAEPFDVTALEDCSDIAQKDADAASCEVARLSLAESSIEPGLHAFTLTNPETAACHTEESLQLRVVAPPVVSSIAPEVACDPLEKLRIFGSGFLQVDSALPEVRVAGQTVQVSTLSNCEELETSGLTVRSCSEIELDLMVAAVPTGDLAIEVSNPAPAGCAAAASFPFRREPSPIVFFVDPPVLYGAIPIEITIFTSGLSDNATTVELVRDGERVELDFTSAERPNKILAQVPAGLTPATWDVLVANAGGCPGLLPGGLTIGTTLTDTLVRSIKPSYASTTEDTAVTISGSGLTAVPRVYLTTAGTTGTARALRAVEVQSSGNTLTAVIPSGLTPGTYDLIVVNPDGKIAVLDDGVTITADKPPVVTTVTPASLPANASAVPITISGTGFKSGAAVELDCLTTGGQRTTVATAEQVPSGDGTSVVVNVTMSAAAPSAVDAGSVCLVRLTNTDGAFFEYSAFSVTNSSLNLSPWDSAPALATARRALSLVAGRPTATSRFLYAIGGDDGVANAPDTRGDTVYDSLESSQVDVFGAMSSWSAQRNSLPSPRTAAGAVAIGRFVYLAGGYDGEDATATLFRASILDPLAGPEISDIDAALSDGSKGLGQGLYYYRIAALETSGDLDNPNGETLAGELLPVQLPERAEKIALTLEWNAVAGARGYRVYRSPQADAAADSLQLLGEISCGSAGTACDCTADPTRCRWLDEGAATMASATPLPVGSLGRWHAVDGARCTSGDCALGSAREGLAVTSIVDPTDRNRVYLYAFGGRDAAGSYLDTYEVATVTIAADGGQTVADFAPGTDTLAVPRADHGVWVMNRSNANVIASSGTPDDVWVYVGGGRTTGGGTNNTLEAGELGASGILAAFVATDSLNGALVGFGTGASNDQLYTFGGIDGSADGTSASLCDGGGSCNPLPDLKSGAFNALGAATTERMFAGSTQESAFFFVAGGHDGDETISSAQRTVQ